MQTKTKILLDLNDRHSKSGNTSLLEGVTNFTLDRPMQ